MLGKQSVNDVSILVGWILLSSVVLEVLYVYTRYVYKYIIGYVYMCL